MNTLNRQQFQQKCTNAVVINVLDEEFYNNEHIQGSINIPVDALDFLERVNAAADKSEPVIVYSGSYDDLIAERAARKLEDEGYSQVYSYVGGMEEWKEAGAPLESNIPGAVDEIDEEDSATGGCGCGHKH